MNYKSMVRSVKDYIRLPFCYNHWYVAGLIEEFGQEPTAKTLLERSIVFYRTEAGKLVAMQNRCLHRSFPLSNGFREGDNLVCRYHGIRYTPNGTIAKVPCQEHVPNRKLHVYPIKEVGPFAFIWMGIQNNRIGMPFQTYRFWKIPAIARCMSIAYRGQLSLNARKPQ